MTAASDARLLRFLRKLPHDFANAILPFQIAGDLLRRANGDAATLDQVSRILDDQSAQAQRLIEDLDRAVLVLRGELEPDRRRCDLSEVVAQGVAAALRHAPSSSEIVTVPSPSPIDLRADPALVAAAVEELVDNAARFGGAQPIRIEIDRAGDEALVRVRDGGPGISKDRASDVFEPFVASDTIDAGWGIGLGFVRLVAVAHGGSITIEPGDLGSGLVATLRLPF